MMLIRLVVDWLIRVSFVRVDFSHDGRCCTARYGRYG